ncbi:MAG: amidohydrolase family protein, partial [Methyloceanibacter sp.]
MGEDVWYAHAVHVNDDEVRLFAKKGAGVCHCPSSNMRLASGIAPIKKYIDAGVRTGLGVDGSASYGRLIVDNGDVVTIDMGPVVQEIIVTPRAWRRYPLASESWHC